MRGKLDQDVGNFFFGYNIPFAVADHPLFTKMISDLRPGYSAPNRKTLAGPLLDVTYEDTKKSVRVQLKEDNAVTLIQDGWSNVHNEPVVAHNICSKGKTVFLNSVTTEAMEKTAENCAQIAEDAMDLAKKEYGVTVAGVCTDNASTMNKMRDILKNKHDGLETWGCSAHLLNLLGQSITPDKVIGHVVKVQKHFRNHHREAALLKQEPKTVKPVLPCQTRWSSQISCMESYLQNRSAYIKICDEVDRVD